MPRNQQLPPSDVGPASAERHAPAYVTASRKVHLVCVEGQSPSFLEAVAGYLSALGLTVSRLEIDRSTGLPDFLRTLGSEKENASAAVIPIESQKPGAETPSIPAARMAPLTTAVAELCAAELPAPKCFAVAQRDDPLEADDISLDVIRLSNDADARAQFKERLLDAGCIIAGDLVTADQPLHEFEFPREWWNVTDESEGMPPFTEFLVNSAFNRKLTQTKLQEEAMDRVRDAKELDLKYHYVGWKMAENWNRLTDDQTYAHGHHRQQLSRLMEEMIAVLPTDANFRYISLGPGDGKTDVEILPPLSKALSITSLFFVDVSIELLQVATNKVITDLIVKKKVISPRHIRAVLGDFEDSLAKLAPVLVGFGDRSLFSLSGFTVGNSTERKLIVSLSEGMQPGDFLLLDARLHGMGKVTTISDEQKEQIIKPYKSSAMKKFAFGPVEDLCDYVVRLDDPGNPEIKIEYNPEVGTRTSTDVEHAVNVYIVAEGLYGNERFRKKVGLEPLSSFAPMARREKKKTLRLVTLTFYDFGSLEEWFNDSGLFKVRWKKDLDRIGLFLLERTGAGAV